MTPFDISDNIMIPFIMVLDFTTLFGELEKLQFKPQDESGGK